MPASRTRNEYYWIHHQLVMMQNHRATVYGRWPQLHSESELVVAIENRGDSKKITEGSSATPSRLTIALLREQRLCSDQHADEIGVDVPEELIQIASRHVKDAVAEVTRQYSELANEERKTGAVTYEINRQRVIESNGWSLTVSLQGFSTQNKEPIIGADLGIVVDLKSGERQVSKGLWVQAKETATLPEDPLTLPRLRDQMEKMLNRTKDAYGMIFTQAGVYVFQGLNSQVTTTLEDVLTESQSGSKLGSSQHDYPHDGPLQPYCRRGAGGSVEGAS